MHANIKLESTELLVDFGAGGWGSCCRDKTRQERGTTPLGVIHEKLMVDRSFPGA